MSQTLPKLHLDPPQTVGRADSRDELNLAEFPIALLTDRAPDGQHTLEFKDTILDPRTGHHVQRKLTISSTEKYGLPTALDDDVILGLIQLTRLRTEFRQRTVPFSRYELIRLLGWSLKGPSYRRLEQSLDRWMSVYLSYEHAWWDHDRKGWVDEKFHILERVTLFEGRKEPAPQQQDNLPFSSFTWNEVVFRSFQQGYLKGLDLEFYLGLRSPTAKRIYRFLDKHFYHRARLDYDLHEFAFEHIGLSRVYRTGVLKQKLASAIEELEAKGFLEPLPPSQRYLQVRRGKWRAQFVKKLKDKPALPAGTPNSPLQKALTDRGVTAATATELVAAVALERIAEKLEVFDWLAKKHDKRLSENPAGYLVASIRGDYAAPKDFAPAAERERIQQAVKDVQRQKQEAMQRVEAEEAAARQASREHIDRTLATLSAAQRQELERRARAAGGAVSQRCFQEDHPKSLELRRAFLDTEVLKAYPLPLPRG